MSLRTTLIGATAALCLTLLPALAGPYRDAEARIASAYADYRTALFQTNQKNQAATDAALASFKTKWTTLAADWKAAPPPQYVDDAKLGDTLAEIARVADEAAKLSAAGDLAKSHEVLEAIRDALGALRARNGVVVFSDVMNAYHELMERVVDHKYDSPADLTDDVAVLVYLVKEVGTKRPTGGDPAEFEKGFKAMEASVAALKAAVRSGDAAAIAAARKGLKPPYSRLFARFG